MVCLLYVAIIDAVHIITTLDLFRPLYLHALAYCHVAGLATVTYAVCVLECQQHTYLLLCFAVVVLLVGVFVLLQAYPLLMTLRGRMSWEAFKDLFIGLMIVAGGLVFMAVVFLTWAG